MYNFKDNRGSLTVFPCKEYDQILVAHNEKRGTFRGMHYQESPRQTKQIRVIQGHIIDFFYNLETKELNYCYLYPHSEPLFIDEKHAHGYLTLHENTVVAYGIAGEYNVDTERSIPWFEIPDLKEYIDDTLKSKSFGIRELIISEKDKVGK